MSLLGCVLGCLVITTEGLAVGELWTKLGSASTRREAEGSLDELKRLEEIQLWRSADLQPRYKVTLEQLETVTQVDADAFGVAGSQQVEKIAAFVLGLTLSGMISSTAAAETLTFLPEIARFSVVQGLCFSPFLALSFGIAAPETFQRQLTTAYAELSPAYRARLARHEAGHVLVGHLLGLPLAEVSANPAAAAAQFYDYGRVISRSQLDIVAIVSLAGLMAEVCEFGQAEGAAADLGQLQALYDAAGLDNEDQLDTTRWAALQAFLLLKRNALPLERLVLAFQSHDKQQRSTLDVADAIAAIEAVAESSSSSSSEDTTTTTLDAIRRHNRVEPSLLERIFAVQGSRQDSLWDDNDTGFPVVPSNRKRSPPGRNDDEPSLRISPDDVPYLAFGVTMCFVVYAVNGGITLH